MAKVKVLGNLLLEGELVPQDSVVEVKDEIAERLVEAGSVEYTDEAVKTVVTEEARAQAEAEKARQEEIARQAEEDKAKAVEGATATEAPLEQVTQPTQEQIDQTLQSAGLETSSSVVDVQ